MKRTPRGLVKEEIKNVSTPVEEGFLTKDMIFAVDDLKKEKVEIPEWNGFVYVSMMTAKDRDEFEKDMVIVKEDGTSERNLHNFRAALCARTICNPKGKRMFQSADEIDRLGEKSAAAIERIFAAAMRINRIGKKDVEELTKN